MGRMESFQPAPPAAVSRVLATFDRDQLAGFIAVAIDLLDLADGDTDVEPNGDEEDSDGDERGDPAWLEWTSLHPTRRHGPNIADKHEDDEEDDAPEEDDHAGGNVEDEGEAVNEDGVGDLSPLLPKYGVDQSQGPINEAEGYRAWQRSLS